MVEYFDSIRSMAKKYVATEFERQDTFFKYVNLNLEIGKNIIDVSGLCFRKVGKTTYLTHLANREKCLLIVPNRNLKEQISKKEGLTNIFTVGDLLHYKQKNVLNGIDYKGIYIDEGLSYSDILKIDELYTRINKHKLNGESIIKMAFYNPILELQEKRRY